CLGGDAVATTAPSPLNIYGGKNPAEMPAYLLAEAAHYLRLPTTTVRSWAIGRDYPTGTGVSIFDPVIAAADPSAGLLSFLNLAELHVLSSIRRVHKVKLKAVRQAIKYLRKKFHSKYPLIEKQMLTDGKDLLIEQYGELVNISEQGQMEMKAILITFLK